jgi:dienelactone hydrolase
MPLLVALAFAAAAPVGQPFVEALAAGHAQEAEASFTPKLVAAMPAPKLAELWSGLVAQLGPFEQVQRVDLETGETQRFENVVIRFTRGRRALRLTVDAQDKISGLYVRAADDARARKVLALLEAGQEAPVEAQLSPRAREALHGQTLTALWKQLQVGLGPLTSVKGTREKAGLTFVDCVFGGHEQTLGMAFDEESGLLGVQLLDEKQWSPPPYADVAKFEERALALGPQKLSAMLTLPRGVARYPAVVLVPGSGPSDMDETIDGIKPFKDLAQGLASRGVAVLRFEKRAHRGIAAHTVKDELEDDVQAAVALLSATPEVERVIAIGHSLGATVLPRVAQANPKIAAVALLAGTTWPLQRTMVAQLEYQQALGVPGIEAMLAGARALEKRVDDLALKPTDELERGGLTGAYFIDLRGYSPVEVAGKLTVPIFIGWGERDLKTIPADFNDWRALSRRPNVTLKTYAGLQHLFTPVGEVDGHVAPALIEDLLAWMAKSGSPQPR